VVVVTEAPAVSSDRYVVVDGPFGPLFVAFGEHGLTRVAPAGPGPAELERQYELHFGRRPAPAPAPPAGLLAALRAGSPRGLAVDLRALSAFGRAVLDVTALIPLGQVRTYAWVAGQVGRPRAVRAVGSALARNPLPVLIPCHRVVRSDGQVGEYAFGTAVKRAMLEQEGADLRAEGPAPDSSGSAW
jgi:methylated-DNA-[protein]-cysteine S-methyltransferase